MLRLSRLALREAKFGPQIYWALNLGHGMRVFSLFLKVEYCLVQNPFHFPAKTFLFLQGFETFSEGENIPFSSLTLADSAFKLNIIVRFQEFLCIFFRPVPPFRSRYPPFIFGESPLGAIGKTHYTVPRMLFIWRFAQAVNPIGSLRCW